MRGLDADLILAQEVVASWMPPWVREERTVVQGVVGRSRKDWRWGSVIVAKPELRLVADENVLEDPRLQQLYDLVLPGRIRVSDTPFAIASVHTAAMPVLAWIQEYATSLSLSALELEALRRPDCDEAPYLNDLAFTALAGAVSNERFIVGGDWNTCRRYDGGPEFFVRAKSLGWHECHQEPEQSSYFQRGTGTYQLDHVFTDMTTAASVEECRIDSSPAVLALSDHAPMVVDLRL